jgi:hypothetical protein
MPNPDGTMTLHERWAADEELGDELAAEGDSFIRTDPATKARWQEDVDGEGDLSAAYGPGAKPHDPPDRR